MDLEYVISKHSDKSKCAVTEIWSKSGYELWVDGVLLESSLPGFVPFVMVPLCPLAYTDLVLRG